MGIKYIGPDTLWAKLETAFSIIAVIAFFIAVIYFN